MIKAIKAARRPTLADVARAAGLSVPTVDRVLNRRAPVQAETAQRVHAAAETLGYHAARLIGRRTADIGPARRLAFLLQRRGSGFYRMLATDLVRAVKDPVLGQHTPVIEHMEDLTPAAVADRIARMQGRCDALAIVAADHPKVNAAVERLVAAGTPVYTLLSNISAAHAGYFAIDHRKAGRTAAWLVSRLAGERGDVAIVLGNHRYLGHELCEISFRAYLREHAPGFRLLEPVASFEDTRFAYEATLDLLRRSPDLAALYVPGGGIEGVVTALRERPAGPHVAVVAMDLFAETRAALLEGVIDVVMATPTAEIATALIKAMLVRLAGGGTGEPSGTLPFRITVSENL